MVFQAVTGAEKSKASWSQRKGFLGYWIKTTLVTSTETISQTAFSNMVFTGTSCVRASSCLSEKPIFENTGRK